MIWPLLRTRRWIGFTAVVVAAIVAFGLLSSWQWSRAEDRRAERTALESAAEAAPRDWPSAVEEARSGTDWVPAQVTGIYEPDAQVLVRKRPYNSRNGFWVMTVLETPDSRVWVNRGWIPAGADALSTPDIPTPPAGSVTVDGLLRTPPASDPGRNEGLPSGQVADADPRAMPQAGALPDLYLQRTSSDPADPDVIPVELPEIDDGRNISYAVQWALFALVAIGGWYFFLRREAIEDAQSSDKPDLIGRT
jgi:cytochrome oxidase assembly protein ShyY1